eukprot:2705455-Ditylum_brightwellii.AAC.1
MSASDTVNRNEQFPLGIEEAVCTTSIKKGFPAPLLAFSPAYMGFEAKKRGGMNGFICEILVEREGFLIDPVAKIDRVSPLHRQKSTMTIDPSVTDPFLYTCMPFTKVQDISRQQKHVVCMDENRRKATS